MELAPNSEVKLTPDLEKARDEKCIPVAEQILDEMAVSLLPLTPDVVHQYDTLQLFILQKMLDGEMNITTEAQYLFQLVLGAFSGFNTAVHSLELEPVNDQRYLDIGRKMLAILAETKPRMTNVTPEESAADFAEAREKLQALFKEEKLNKIELQYVMDSIFSSVKSINNLVSESLAQSSARAEAKIFGIESLAELTVKHVNDVLVNDVKTEFTKPVPPAPPEGQVTPGPETATPPAGDAQVAPPETPPAA